MRTILSLSAALVLALAVGGCASKPSPVDPARRGPLFVPRNYAGDPRLPRAIQRVLLLPVHGEGCADQDTVASLDEIFATALQRQMRFEVVTLSRDECMRCFDVADLGSTDPLPHDFMRVLAEKYAVEGVI